MAPDKIETKKEMLSKYQLMISDFYNIFIGNVKKMVPNLFDKEKYVVPLAFSVSSWQIFFGFQ